MTLTTFAVVTLLSFSVIGSLDALWYHLVRERLYARKDSIYEHRLHTARMALMAPIAIVLYAMPSSGALLWLGVAFLVVDQVVEVLDVREERRSRRSSGGLSRGESAVHLVATALRVASVVAILASRPLASWDPRGSFFDVGVNRPTWMMLALVGVALTSVLSALHHIVLDVGGRAERGEATWRLRLPWACCGRGSPASM